MELSRSLRFRALLFVLKNCMTLSALLVDADKPRSRLKSVLGVLMNSVDAFGVSPNRFSACSGGVSMAGSFSSALVAATGLPLPLRDRNCSVMTVSVFLLELFPPLPPGLNSEFFGLAWGVTMPVRVCNVSGRFSCWTSAAWESAAEGVGMPLVASLAGPTPNILPSPILSMERPLRCLPHSED